MMSFFSAHAITWWLTQYSIVSWAVQVAEGAKAAGAARIIGVDIDPSKFDRGSKFLKAPSLIVSS